MKKLLFALLVPAVAVAAGCSGDDGDDNDAATETREVALNFEGVVGDQPFSCENTYTVRMSQTEVQFSEFKLFVSEVVFLDADGTEVPMELTDDGAFQEGTVAMLDFEDATGACGNGTPETNFTVRGTVPADLEEVGVSFKVGVPFESNHQNQAEAPDPLSLAQMFWNWQGGYKFLRIDGQTVQEQASVRLHLGSTACQLRDGSTTEVAECGNPNRVTVVRDNVDIDNDVFTVDIAELVEDVDLTADMDGNAVNCQSFPDHTDCEQVFPKYGLSWKGADAGAQTFINVK